MDEKFSFKEVDEEGMETLEVISDAHRLNKWMYDTIKPYLNGEILEIGSGIGNISQFFLDDKKNIHVSDIRENYCNALDKKFMSYPTYSKSLLLDIAKENFEKDYPQLLGKFNSVFALNVIEHIENDHLALSNCLKLLKPGGKIVILVPAYQTLYNRFDEELLHFRRYNNKNLKKALEDSGFITTKTFYFNMAGIMGWYVSGKLMKNKIIPKGQMSFYNTLVPVFKLADKLFLNKIGLSVVAVGEKK